MNLKEFINTIKTGQQTEFMEAQGKNGKVIIAVIGDKKYVINASIKNFLRFKPWVGETALSDIKKTGMFHKTEYGFLPTVEIRTNVKIKDDGSLKQLSKKSEDEDEDEEDEDDDE